MMFRVSVVRVLLVIILLLNSEIEFMFEGRFCVLLVCLGVRVFSVVVSMLLLLNYSEVVMLMKLLNEEV